MRSPASTRVAALVAVVCAVLGGAVLIAAGGVLAETGLRSHLEPGRLGGADVVVTAEQSLPVADDLAIALPERRRVPAGLVGELATLPGAAAVVGDVSFPAAAITDDGQPAATDPASAGHGWSSTTLLDTPSVEGTAPVAADEVALDASLARALGARPGGRVQLVADGERGTHRVTAVVAGGDAAGIFFVDAKAAELAGERRGTVDLVGLRAESGRADALTDAVRGRVDGRGLVVSTGAAIGDTPSPAAGGLLVAVGSSASGTVALIVGFVTAGALSLSVAAQRRDLALLRAVGATLAQVRSLAAGQAMLAAAPAAVVGAALGYPLAAVTRGRLGDLGLLPDALALAWSPVPALVAVALLLGVVRVAAIGLGVSGPALLRRGEMALRSVLPAGVRAPAWLAVINLRGYAVRGAGAVAALAVVIVFVLTTVLTQTTLATATSTELREGTSAELSITAPGLGGVPADIAGTVVDVPGVRAAAASAHTSVVWPSTVVR